MMNTTLCYIEKDNKYLMLHRTKKKNDINHDKWLGIGGKIEDGESPYDCIRREVYEETGLKISTPLYRGIVTFTSDIYETEFMHLFTTTNYEGIINDECTEGELVWVDKKDVFELPVWEGDKIFFDLLEKTSTFFSLKLEYKNDKLVKYHINE